MAFFLPQKPRPQPSLSLLAFLRHLSSCSPSQATPTPLPPQLKKLSYHHRPAALAAARAAVADYLHTTRALPFSHADSIASLSPFSLSLFLSQIPLPASLRPDALPTALRRHLSFSAPLDEFPFFFESIGLPPLASPARRHLFLSDDPQLLAAVSALAYFGFPWPRLGLLYPSALRAPVDAIAARLRALEARLAPHPRAALIAACLEFPSLLVEEFGSGSGSVGGLVSDLRKAFTGLQLDKANGIDLFPSVCKRMRRFYGSETQFGEMGELMGRNRRVFLELEEETICEKLELFKKLGMRQEEVGSFLLRNAGLFDLDFRSTVISVPEYLQRVGLPDDEAAAVVQEYPYVIGKNRLGNLPGVLRVTGLSDWFLDKIAVGGDSLRYLSPDFVSVDSSYDAKIDKEFLEGMEKVKGDKKAEAAEHIDNKLEFLLSIGLAENKTVTRMLPMLHSTKGQLQERFDYLLERGFEYPLLCRMLRAFPKILNQGKELLQEKLSYLTDTLGYDLEYLHRFPAFLCFDLENRMKRRYAILHWLREHGLLKRPLAPATVLASSEKSFVLILYSMHPAAPKQWLECFSSRTHVKCYRYRTNMFQSRSESVRIA